jgi:hypothetical protein
MKGSPLLSDYIYLGKIGNRDRLANWLLAWTIADPNL